MSIFQRGLLAAISLASMIGLAQASGSVVFGDPGYEEVSVSVGGDAHELAHDAVNSRLYVSVPSLDRVTVINTDDWSVEQELTVFPTPRGLAVTQDGSTLYVAKDGVGGVEVINTSDWSRSDISISSELDSSATWDVILGPNDENLYVSANGNSGSFAYIVQVEVNNGNAATRIAHNSSGNPTIIRCQPRFEFSPDYTSLYVSECFSPPSIYRLDMTQAGAPIVAQDDHGALDYTEHMEVSPDGSRLYVSTQGWWGNLNGVVLDAYTLDIVDAVPPGISRFGEDPDVIFLAREPDQLNTWDLSADTIVDSLTLPCSEEDFKEVVVMPDDRGFVVLMGSTVCGLVVPTPTVIGPGNILICSSDWNGGSYDSTLYEYTADGVFVDSSPIPFEVGSSPWDDNVRDLVVDQDGDLHIYHDSGTAVLATRSALNGEWEYHTHGGWSTGSNLSYGGIAAFGDYVFVTDNGSSGGSQIGLIRFDTRDWSSVRFSVGESYHDLNMGRDGLLYALKPSLGGLDVFEPEELTLIRNVTLSGNAAFADKRGVVVDAAGDIYFVTWSEEVIHCNSEGEVLQEFQLSVPSSTMDLDIDPFGNLVIGSRFGDVTVLDTSLTSASVFTMGSIQTGQSFFVAFTQGSAAGANYCSSVPNSTNQAARITASGTHSLALDDLTLEVGPIPNNFYIFYVGPGEARRSFGNGGSLCVGGGMLRYPAHMATDNTGSMSVLPGEVFVAGDVARFQCWFRDPGVGPDYFNSSDGYVIQFVP